MSEKYEEAKQLLKSSRNAVGRLANLCAHRWDIRSVTKECVELEKTVSGRNYTVLIYVVEDS